MIDPTELSVGWYVLRVLPDGGFRVSRMDWFLAFVDTAEEVRLQDEMEGDEDRWK